MALSPGLPPARSFAQQGTRRGPSGTPAEHVVPIWQTNPHPEHATGARAINQEAIDLLCPDGSGRGQLEQTLAHNDELVAHFQNLGDRSGFLITHEVRPIDSSQARHQAPLAGKIKKTSSFKNRYCLWLF
ncbi:MAG TPA: hypothetical protein VLW83_00660 [Candidatus Acidoferrales bacterium]|nr:hypothetical protein [Candidatus Acidoferrales bacterium]